MKKIYITISVVLVAILGVGTKIYVDSQVCRADGTRVCFDVETGAFILEANASLTLYLKTQEQKQWLLEQLKDDIANYNISLEIEIMDELTAWEATYQIDADVFYTQKQDAAMIFDDLLVIDPMISDRISLDGLEHFVDVINMDGFRFLPTTYQGLLFVYNETLLEQLGFDVSNKDEKNRIKQLSDWEDLIKLNEQWQQDKPVVNGRHLTSVFPFTVSEPWQFYAFLTSSGWQMFEDLDASDPDFLSTDFYHSLLFIDKLFNTSWDLSEQNNSRWRYERALINMEAPFSVAPEWLDWDEVSLYNNQIYRYSAFPSNQSVELTPLVKVGGLVIRNNEFPSLSHRIFSLLSSHDNMQTLIDSTTCNLAIPINQLDQYELTESRKERIKAFSYSVSEPLIALENNPDILGWDFYLQGRVHQVILQVFEKEITIEQAQKQLVEDYQQWYIQHNQNGDNDAE